MRDGYSNMDIVKAITVMEKAVDPNTFKVIEGHPHAAFTAIKFVIG